MESKKKLSVPNEAITRSTAQMAEKTGNLYETVMVIAKRANQEELKSKLEEFNKGTDTLEEVYENAEQIEVSRCYERLPKPTLIATAEYDNDELYFRLASEKGKEE